MKAKWLVIIFVILVSFVGLVWFLGIGGFIAGVFESVLIIVMTNLDKTMSLLASVYKIFRNVHFWFERSAVEKRLESTISLSSRKINGEGVNVLPHGVDVKWVEPKDRDAFLRDNKIVVCLESSLNENRNLARASFLYVAEDLIKKSQRFVNRAVMKSLNFAVTRKMLMMDGKIDAIRCLNEEFIEPEANNNPRINTYLSAMEKMDEQGHLTRILLNEFSELDAKLPSVLSDPRASSETESFTELLKTFEEREREENVPLNHQGQIIRVHLFPIARIGGDFDSSRFVNRAQQFREEGIDKLYALARGANVHLAKYVIEAIEERQLYKRVSESVFKIPSSRQRGRVASYVAVLSRITD